MPVHLVAPPPTSNTTLKVAGARKIPVVEDACQAHLAEWGTQGWDLGHRRLFQLPGQQEP